MRHLKRSWVAGAVALLAAGVTGAGSASAATPTQLFTTAAALGLPPNAAATPDGQLGGISCTSVGNCTAVGSYEDSGGTGVAIGVTESDGAWGSATPITAPANLSDVSTTADEQSAVSCTGPGDCVTVGAARDSDQAGNTVPVVATQSDGSWSAAALTPPAQSQTGSSRSQLSGVSCWSTGNCLAVGYYEDPTTGDTVAMLATETNGSWQTSQFIAGPATGTAVTLRAVSCTGDATCTVGGSDVDAAGDTVPFTASGRGGALTALQTLALPADALTGGQGQAGINAIACPGDGACTAVGYYRNASLSPAIAWTESGGSFGAPSSLASVAGAPAGSAPYYESVSCAAAGECTAAGGDADGTGTAPAAVSQSNGSWGPAVELSTPAGAVDTTRNDDAAYVSCPAVGVCGLAGEYSTDGQGDTGAMTLSSHLSLGIATTTLPTATVGTPYRAPLIETGGAGAAAWSLSSGVLPAGLALNSSTGVISGTPTTPETLSFTTALADSVSDTPTSTPLSITVIARDGRSKLTAIHRHGLTVQATVSCAGAASQTCAGRLQARVEEHLRGRRIVSVSASRHSGATHRRRTRIRRIVLASAAYALHGGQSQPLTLRLGRRTARLLRGRRRLAIALTLTSAGAAHSRVARRLVLRRSHRSADRHSARSSSSSSCSAIPWLPMCGIDGLRARASSTAPRWTATSRRPRRW